MRKVWILAVPLLLGLVWWFWPKAQAPEVAARSTRAERGAPCRIEGSLGSAAARILVHSGPLDVPAVLSSDGLAFSAELPVAGPFMVIAEAADGRTTSAGGVCRGEALRLSLRFPEQPASAARLNGHCRYLETGAPVPQAAIKGALLVGNRGVGEVFSALTQEDGSFSVAVSASAYLVRCAADGEESAAQKITLEPGAEAKIDLFLEARASVAGVVVDAQGAPASGIEVRGSAAREGIDLPPAIDISAEDGSFLLQGFQPGPVRVEAQAEGDFAEAHTIAQVALPYAEVRLQLQPSPVRLEGAVTSAMGPVGGATVEASGLTHRGPPLRRATVTDIHGRFVLGGLAPGKVELLARAPGYTESEASLTVAVGTNVVQLSLSAACATQIEVLPAEPRLPVVVRAFGEEDRPLGRVSGNTGQILQLEAAAGPAQLEARTSGVVVRTATLSTTLCGPRVQLLLQPSQGSLQVQVVDQAQKPVAGVAVWIYGPTDQASPTQEQAETGAEGWVRFDGLKDGEYRVGTPGQQPDAVTVQGDSRHTLRLDRTTGEITGVVVSGDQPVEGARIFADCAPEVRMPNLERATVVARSDAQGAFVFVPEGGGLCVVRAEHPSRGQSNPVTLRAGGEPGRLVLQGSARISGWVRAEDPSLPVVPYTLVLRTLGRASAIEARSLYVSAPDGRFVAEGLSPGRISLGVQSPAGRTHQELELAPGESKDNLELVVFGNGSVRGQVTSNGKPLAGASVSVQNDQRPLARGVTNAEGSFEFQVPSGDPLRVFLTAKDHYPWGSLPFDVASKNVTDLGALPLQPKGSPDEKEGGIGVMFGPDPKGVRILRFGDDSPAREAGLQVGDVITAIDGVPAGRMPMVNWVVLLRGPVNTAVLLQVERGTRAPFQVSVMRRAIGLPAMPEDAAP